MKIALLSNVTVDLLADDLRNDHDIYLSAGFDTWQQELILTNSGLYNFGPETIVLLLHANAYTEAWTAKDTGCQLIDEWIMAIRNLTTNLSSIPVFVSSIDVSNNNCRFGAEKRLDEFFENYLIEQIEQLHDNGSNVYILPVSELISDMGRKNFYSNKMWYFGSMPYSMKGISELGSLIKQYVSVTKGAKKKCIAVDLDNTLWGGVIGEDGVEGIQLSNNKEGARFKDTQRILKRMKDRGVMVAILSKNNVEDVEPVFSHPDMILQHEDFVAEVINWEPKSANIRQLAIDLNIGLDAFVFLDDNPAEREQMKGVCPEVAVIDFPKDSSNLPDVVAKAYEQYFLALEVTGEDLKKTDMYRSEVQRKAVQSSAASIEDFLAKLEMTMDIHLMKDLEEKRVTQLTNKTNQFNLTTKRYSEDEIHTFATGDNSDIITVHMADKYGDQGLVSVMILKYEGEVAEIDTFLMSCRVMGRCAENEIMARVKEYLVDKGITTIKASYIKTKKNAPVLELYEKLGFEITGSKISGTEPEIGDYKEYKIAREDISDSTGVFKTVKAFE